MEIVIIVELPARRFVTLIFYRAYPFDFLLDFLKLDMEIKLLFNPYPMV